MNYTRFNVIQMLGCLGLTSCTQTKLNEPEVYNMEYYLSEEDRAKNKKKAQNGNGRSAIKLADYEAMWGDPKKAVYWYKFAYDLGYKKEKTKVQMESFARLDPETEKYLISLQKEQK